MGSYAQWHRAMLDTGPRRVTYVCGDQPVLVEEVVDRTRESIDASQLNRVSLAATGRNDTTVWAAVNQHPLDPDANRLVLVRDAHLLKTWQPLLTWLARSRTVPGVYLCFVGSGADAPKVVTDVLTKGKRGHLVRAAQPNPDDTHAWLIRRAPHLSDPVAAHLLARVGGHLVAAAHVAAKLALFPGGAGNATIDALCEEMPAEGFVECLLEDNKRHALACVPAMTAEDAGRALGLLAVRLDLLAALHRAHRAGRHPAASTGLNPYLARRYATVARRYTPQRCANAHAVLAVVDTALRSGARTGCLECLVALW